MKDDFERYHFSATSFTADAAVLHCLKNLCHWAQRGERHQEIGWGCCREKDWHKHGGQVTFRFTSSKRREAWRAKANELLSGEWTLTSTNDNDPASPEKLPYLIQIVLGVGVACVVSGVVILAKRHWPLLVYLAEKYYPQLSVVIGLVCIVWAFFALLADKDKATQWPGITNHENDSKDFYCDAQGRLRKCVGESELKNLSLELDAQLKLEDFLIKFHEAEHAPIQIWGTVFASGLVSVIVTLLTLFGKAMLGSTSHK